MREMEMTKRHSSARTVVLFAYISVLIVGLFACDNQKDGSSAHSGKLCLSLTADTTSLKKGVNSGLTKAISDEFEKFLTTSDYKIQIVQDDKEIKSYDRFDQMPSEIELPEGSYTLIASKGNNLPAEFENPYFEGSTDFTVKEGMSTPLDVTCVLGNARVTVDYTEDLKKVYSGYSALLKTSFTTAEMKIMKDEVRPAYLQVATSGTDLSITLLLTKVDETKEVKFPVPTTIPLKRRQNVHLIFKTDGTSSGLGLDIWLDNELKELPLWGDIPGYME